MSVKVDITFTGDGVIKTKLNRLTLATEKLKTVDVRRELIAAKDEARIYPSELPGQKYVRTGTYNRSFRFAGSAGKYQIKSDAVQKGRHYTPFVGGYADGTGQAQIHAGRWTLIKDAVERAMDRVRRMAEEEFNRIINSGGQGL